MINPSNISNASFVSELCGDDECTDSAIVCGGGGDGGDGASCCIVCD